MPHLSALSCPPCLPCLSPCLPRSVVLFLAGADSSLCMVGLDSGEPIGHGMRPKNASRPLALALLDATGIPLPLLHGQLVLAWANNNAVGGAVGSSAAAQQAPGEGSSASGAAARVNRLRWAAGRLRDAGHACRASPPNAPLQRRLRSFPPCLPAAACRSALPPHNRRCPRREWPLAAAPQAPTATAAGPAPTPTQVGWGSGMLHQLSRPAAQQQAGCCLKMGMCIV